ncbi:hypothetical protein AYO38_09870 [bacterium SCGC AG-212-C10]|nr:hypothetical protein AYO38_09870 [bacterium SCGC AG-212-C10]
MEAPPVTVVRHSSPLGTWETARRDSHPVLRPFISGYEGYWEEMSFSRRMEVPSTDMPLIIGFGAPLTTIYADDAPGASKVTRSFMAGVHDRYVLCESNGVSAGIQVNFKPFGASYLLGMPVGELANHCVDMADCLGNEGVRLAQQLEDLPDWASRFAALETFILRRFANAKGMPQATAWVLRRLEESAGSIPIRALAEDVGWSQKHLIDQFRAEVGLTPKAVARVIRFDRAVQRLKSPGPHRLSDVANDCGYYDQAHFSRDFRAFTGGTAREFLQRVLPDDAGLIGD